MTTSRRASLLWPLALGVAISFAACNCGGVGAPCQSTQDCGAQFACLGVQTCAPVCTTDATCGSGQKCSASGGCIATGTCGSSDDCTQNQKCVAPGTCESRCVTTADCTATETCLQNQTCAPKCTTAATCASGEKCSMAGACVPGTGCGTNADCSGGMICDSLGKCVSDCRQGKCNPGAFCTPSGQCIATNNPDGGAPTCGGELFQAARVNSNMLIALDKSGSMNDPINGVSKWNIAKTAVGAVTAQYQAQIQFGLMMFPAGSTNQTQCISQPVSVAVGPNTAAAIAAAVDAGTPGGSTPIGGVLTAAGNDGGLTDPNRANYVMLVTDGAETCNGNGVTAATNNLAQKGIKTFVVGFGSAVDAMNLAAIATAGGTPRPGNVKYYQADDAPGLLAAFNQIAQGALGCEYKLVSAPPDTSKVFVYVNGVLQNRDTNHANGWDYNAATVRITFYGGLCNLVATDPSAKVSIVYGCRDDSIIEVDRPDGGANLPNGAACSTNLDCANKLCSSGVCGTPVGSPCTTPGQCASQVCTNGFCAPGIN